MYEAVQHIVSDVDWAAFTLRSTRTELSGRSRILPAPRGFLFVLFSAHLDILAQIIELVEGLRTHLLALNAPLFDRLAEILADLQELVGGVDLLDYVGLRDLVLLLQLADGLLDPLLNLRDDLGV